LAETRKINFSSKLRKCYVCELAIPQGVIRMKNATMTFCNLFLVRASTKNILLFAMTLVALGLALALLSI
jgi:hypothetical protein